jgi:hypothetical protein
MLPNRRHPIPSLNSGWWPFFVDVKPPGLDIWRVVDHPGTCETESYMEKLTFTRACLSSVRVKMVIYACSLVRVSMLGGDGIDSCTWVPAARSACGMRPYPVAPGSKCRHFPRPRCLVKSTWHWKLLDERLDAWACPGLKREVGQTDRWRIPAYPRLP